MYIYKNGSQAKHIYTNYTSPSYGAYGSSVILYLNGSTDYVEFWAYTSANSTITTGSAQTYFNGAMVRAA